MWLDIDGSIVAYLFVWLSLCPGITEFFSMFSKVSFPIVLLKCYVWDIVSEMWCRYKVLSHWYHVDIDVFLINPKNSRVFTREVRNFLKSRLIFIIFYCFWMIVINFSHISRAHISKIKDVLMWNLQRIIFRWRQRYWQIFKSTLVYL